jgi:putative membrane protein
MSTTGGLSSSDRKFLMEAAMGGMAEVELGHRAIQTGQSDTVKQFGQRMVDDHSKANAELTTVASGKGITLPAEIDAKHRAAMARMARLSGANFDRAYAKEMLSDHNKDVALFKKQAETGTDPDLKAFAAKTLPTLEEHQKMAEAMNSALSPASKSSNANSNSNSKGASNSNKP